MNLIPLLPLLRGWYYHPVDLDQPLSVSAGQKYQIQKEIGKGWLISVIAVINNADAEFVLEQEHPYGIWSADYTARALMEAGLLVPNPLGFFCSRYDTMANVYTVCYLPSEPLGFNLSGTISLRAPTNATVTLLNYASVVVKVYEYDVFMESLHKVLGKSL